MIFVLTDFRVAGRFRKEAYEVYRKYQIQVHGDDPDEVSEKGYTRFLASSPLKVRLKDACPFFAS